MVAKRKTFFITMRSRATRLIKRDFVRRMQMHNLFGAFAPDYKSQLLVIGAVPLGPSDNVTQMSKDNTRCDLNFSLPNLSGGERSKTLVCLINALWSVQQPPFRCLDEWDVFLDAIARKNIEGMLVDTALQTEKQYFFISPQGSIFDNVEHELAEKYKKAVKVFRIVKRDNRC